MDVARFVGRRLVQLVVVLFFVTLFTSALLRLIPGDAADIIVPLGNAQEKAEFRSDVGLDKPFFEQYVDYIGNLLEGDFGKVYANNTEVSDLITNALPVSLQLMLYAQVLALVFAIPLGVLTAYRAGTRTDRSVNIVGFALLALPSFVLALVLSYIIGTELKWLPSQGYEPGVLDWVFTGVSPDIGGHIETMILPTIALAAGQIAVYMRLLRSDMIATLQEDFITMARAKGISDRRVLWRHALRPSSLTLLTVGGLNLGTLITGSIIVEFIFGLGGIGSQIGSAISQKSYIELQGYVVVIALLLIVLNFAIDFLYSVVDPRIRRARAA